MSSTAELRRRLLALGFDEVKITRADFDLPGQAANAAALRTWLDAGYQADMHWIERGLEKRLQPDLILSGVKSIILLGVNYWPGDAATQPQPNHTQTAALPRWARYAQYSDYHDTLKPALAEAGRILEELHALTPSDYRYYVDTGPVLERSWAGRAGLGFIGKNAMLISRDFGNWLFLAAILTRADLTPDAPLTKTTALSPQPKTNAPASSIGLLCGKCTRCIDTCPTAAIVAPGTVDARRCISYQTIENKGIIPRELRAAIGAHIYGCDICAEVCPWNRFAQASRSVLLTARPEIHQLSLREILTLTPARFAQVFQKTAVKRVKLPGLLRNACIVAANLRATDCLAILVQLTSHETALIRAHAVWAVIQIAGQSKAAELLRDRRTTEQDPTVLAEYT